MSSPLNPYDPETDYTAYCQYECDSLNLFYGDPIHEVEIEYWLEKAGVTWDDPQYGFWYQSASDDLKGLKDPTSQSDPMEEAA